MTLRAVIPHRTGRGADTSTLRGHNLTLVLQDVRDHQPTLRSEIAARTQLARGSVTTLVPELMSMGLLRESREGGGSLGRPSAPLEVDGSGLAAVAVQITGIDITTESVDLGARRILTDRRQHGGPESGSAEIIDLAAAMLEDQLDELARRGIAFARAVVVISAPVIGSPPIVMAATDLGWGALDIVAELVARVPVLEDRLDLVNDAAMAALAEHLRLRATGVPAGTIVYLKSDTGIGGGVIVDGEVLYGAHGTAFEPGHVVVRHDGSPCHCGRSGCLVAEIGPDATAEAAGLGPLRDTSGITVAIARLVEQVLEGDPRAVEVMGGVGRILHSTLENMALLFDPDRIVIGGYWADVFDALDLTRPMSERLVRLRSAREESTRGDDFVIPGRLGSRAAREGALSRTIDAVMESPLLFP